MEEELRINVITNDKECCMKLSERDTICILKLKIYEEFKIPPSKQIIEGWKNHPINDYVLLTECLDVSEELFLIVNSCEHTNTSTNVDESNGNENTQFSSPEEDTNFNYDVMEKLCCSHFITNLLNKCPYTPLEFHNCTLKSFLEEILSEKLEERKANMLFLYNSEDPFTKCFCPQLQNKDVINILKNFRLLGWDLEKTEYHDALIRALEDMPELTVLTDMIITKTSAALIIMPINNSIIILSCIRGKISDQDILKALQGAWDITVSERDQEINLHNLANNTSNENDIGSEEYQRLIADRLGDRDYDNFEHNEHEYLKSKIGYALYGPPPGRNISKEELSKLKPEELDYSQKMKKEINIIYEQILNESNQVSEWKDRVIMSFIYNCTEPLPKEKLKRAQKFPDYNPKVDLCPLPIFVIRKCEGSPNPCRIFVDHTGRVYNSWERYITKNKLNECQMILPKNGRYTVNEEGVLLLERHNSPACGLDVKFLKVTDITTSIAGIVGTGVCVAAAIPAITIAPVAVLAGGAVGVGVGIYAIGRSIFTIVDRAVHKEAMSFANSEARGAYLNIVAGTLGFVGAGATMAVSQLTAQGVNLGVGARAVVNTIGVVNVTASGASIVNSTYDVIDKYISDNETPSTLTVVQLTSSILFFGHAVYNFKTAGTIIEETQANTIKDFHDSLRSNRHRKTFSRLLKDTISKNQGDVRKGTSEVIAFINNVHDKDNVFALLTRSNKQFKEQKITVSAQGGKITLNNIPIDVENFATYNKNDMSSVLSNLHLHESPTTSDFNLSQFKGILSKFTDYRALLDVTQKILTGQHQNLQVFVLEALQGLLATLEFKLLNWLQEYFGINFNNQLISLVLNFLLNEVRKLNEQFNYWKTHRNPEYYSWVFEYIKFEGTTDTVINILDCTLRRDFINNKITEDALKRLIEYFYNWIATIMCENQTNEERESSRSRHSAGWRKIKVDCPDCGGYYFKKC